MRLHGIKLGLVDDLKQSALKLLARSFELRDQVLQTKQSAEKSEQYYQTMLKQRNDFGIIEREYLAALKGLGVENKELPEVANAKAEMNNAMRLFGQEIKK